MIEVPLVNKLCLLEKFPGKGGWTYTTLPGVMQDKNAPFGWVVVKGSIDGFELPKYHLMPFGNGELFLPVKAAIRKKIRKEAGHYVHVILYADNGPAEIPEEFLLCLEDDPAALQFFNSLSENEKHNYVRWIYAAKSEQIKIDRMAKTIDMLSKNQYPNKKRSGKS